MPALRYIDDQWRYTTYIASAIILAFSTFVALTAAHYTFNPSYIVPIGTGYSSTNATWTLFVRPWILPSGSSASLADTILGIGLLVALTPVVLISLTNFRYYKSVERNIPRFLRDVLASTDSGLILPRALIQASKSDYGPISNEMGIAMTKFSFGYDFRASVMEAAERLRHPQMPQVGMILAEAYAAGGKIHDVLDSSVKLFNGLEQYAEEKQSELRPYTQLVYISIAIFLVIAMIVVGQFISPFENLAVHTPGVTTGPVGIGHSSQAFNLTRVPPVTYFESIFFIAAILESVFAGIVAGKIVDGSAGAGLKHSLVMVAITIIAFNLPLIGIFGVA